MFLHTNLSCKSFITDNMGFSHISLYVFFPSIRIHAIILLMFFSSTSSVFSGNDTDQLALLQFKAKITKDPLGVLNSWNDTINFCQWYGVTCGLRHARVTSLVLNYTQLTGSMSPYIGNLSFLRVLNLNKNSFSQEIPSEIGYLRRLEAIYLINNSFSGEIPWNLSSCSNLISINFANNHLAGEIPAILGSLSKLRFINLALNHLTGNIPSSFGNLSSLEYLYISNNNLSGIIPDSLGQLKNLSRMVILLNMLTGIIPPSIFNLSSMMTLDVSGNLFHGKLPSNLFISLPSLQFFSIVQNQFTGSIPVSISNASQLVYLELNDNQLKGGVPSLSKLSMLQWLSINNNYLGSGGTDDLSFLPSLVNATTLQILAIQGNNFGGMLPPEICNLTELIKFELNDNQIYGTIPTGMVNLVNLQEMGGWYNQFSGIIPPNIGMLQNLVRLDLDNNLLTGFIPSSFGNLTNLILLNLAGNNLQGSIPSSLGNLQNLQALDLSTNNLSGIIPQAIGLSSLLIGLDLSSNLLIGSLPMEVETLTNLELFNLSENRLSGEIPGSLSSCTSLEFLYLEGNFFHGPIPSSLSSLGGLQQLDVSRNNFSGKIPEFLATLGSLSYLNLSFNDFDGEVPTKGVFTNASATSVNGNNELCGGLLEFHLPACNFENSNKRRLTYKIKIIVAIVSVLAGVTLVLSFIYLLWFRKKRKEPASTSSGPLLWRVSYQSLLKATDGFSPSNLIGVGSYGMVYKGILDQGETVIAVKVLNLLHRGASRSFMAECEALRILRHRNLVKVLTACSSVDFHGNDFKALVYDYMVNGSLEDWLHPNAVISEVNEAPRNLDFLQRLTIAIDVARALEYLHHHCETPVVHCDLKPSNVLLDDEMTAHVGDFGLAKFLSQHRQDVVTHESSSIGVRGTTGYAPPEYGMGSEVSIYGDVYSCGILLLEMFTGKRPTDDFAEEGLNLHNFTKAALPERVAEITDPLLLGEIDEGNMSTNITGNQSHPSFVILECLNIIFEIGVACSQDFPGERMNISDVAAKLHFLREKLLRTRIHGDRHHLQNIQ